MAARNATSPSRAERVVRSASADVVRTAGPRGYVVVGLFLFVALIIIFRLVYLQVIMADEYSSMASAARRVDIVTVPHRGTIYDRNGTVLAVSVDATTVYANPNEIESPVQTAATLAHYLGGDEEDYLNRLLDTDTTFVYIKRQADKSVCEKLADEYLAGVYFIEDTRREYPCGKTGAQIIGICNVDGEGITGLEYEYNDILAGTPGRLVYERGVYNIPIPGGVSVEEESVDGHDIVISIDIQMQDYVEQRLLTLKDELTCSSTTAILMDAGTGEIYAAASLPLLNPNDLESIEDGATTIRGITSILEPGSTFKTVSATALLETTDITPATEIFCPSFLEADGFIIEDASSRDDTTYTFRQIMQYSSNIGISLAVQDYLGFPELHKAIMKYKLDEYTGVDYPGEAVGYLPDISIWSRAMGYNICFGQGVSVTPLIMTRFYGALINDGYEVTPHFLLSKPQFNETPEWESVEVIENKEAIATVVDLLKTVVREGTGTQAAIEGYTVAGKTSTAQIYSEEGGYKEGVYNIGFIGFLPESTSQLVCYVGGYDVPWQANTTLAFRDIMGFAIERFKINPA